MANASFSLENTNCVLRHANCETEAMSGSEPLGKPVGNPKNMSPTLSNDLPVAVFHHLKRKLPVWHVPALAFYFEIKPEVISRRSAEFSSQAISPARESMVFGHMNHEFPGCDDHRRAYE